MKKIMRGVLLFGMLGGMCISCFNKKENTIEMEKKRVFKIGISQIVDHNALNMSKQGFKDALKTAGLHAEYDEKIANNDVSVQNLIMSQFSLNNLDLVFAITTPTAQAAKNQLNNKIPIVFASVTDPIGAGLSQIENITGTSAPAPLEENLKLINEIFPNFKKIGVIYNSSEANSVSEINNLKILSKKFGLEIVEKSVTSPSEIVPVINLLSKEIDIFYAIQDNTVASYFQIILDTLNNSKIPVLGTNDFYSQNGGLISQGTTDYDIGYEAGIIATEILLNNKKPKNIPIKKVINLKIEINKKNMELLGIKIHNDILNKASIIE